MRLLVAKIALVLVVMSGVLAIPSSASATPSNCQNKYAWNTSSSICYTGSGRYRASARCLSIWGYYSAYGPWKRTGQGWSTAECWMYDLLRSYGVEVSSV